MRHIKKIGKKDIVEVDMSLMEKNDLQISGMFYSID